MDTTPDRYIDVLRENTHGLILSSSRMSANIQVCQKVLTCGLSELVPFRSKSKFDISEQTRFAGSEEKLDRLERRLTAMLERGLLSTSPDEAVQTLSGHVPDVLKWLVADTGRTNPHKAGKLLLRMMDVTVEWLRCVSTLQRCWDCRRTTTCRSTAWI